MEKIIENVTKIYKNGGKLVYDAIQITNKGIYTGRIIRHHETKEFQDNRFIPRDEIQQIMIFNEQGNVKHIEL